MIIKVENVLPFYDHSKPDSNEPYCKRPAQKDEKIFLVRKSTCQSIRV